MSYLMYMFLQLDYAEINIIFVNKHTLTNKETRSASMSVPP